MLLDPLPRSDLFPSCEDSYIPRLRELTYQLERSERDLQAFWNLSPDLFLITDRDHRILKANPAWKNCLGYLPEQVIGTSYRDYLHPEDREVADAASQQLEHGPIFGFRNRYRHADGSYRWLEWSASCYREDGTTYAIGRDVTHRIRGEDQLQALHRYQLNRLRAGQSALVNPAP